MKRLDCGCTFSAGSGWVVLCDEHQTDPDGGDDPTPADKDTNLTLLREARAALHHEGDR